MQISACYFDGKSPNPHKVKVRLDAFGDSWIVEGDGIGRLRFSLTMTPVPELAPGSERVIIPLAGEARLEFDNTDEMEGLFVGTSNSWISQVVGWPKNKLYLILTGLALTVAFGCAILFSLR